MATYPIFQGDLELPLAATLTDAHGPIPLTGATVTLIASQVDGSKVITGPCTIVDAALGKIQYIWQAGDTSVVGIFRLVFRITYPGNRPRTVPSDGWDTLEVLPLP